jgi:hypothetical protein
MATAKDLIRTYPTWSEFIAHVKDPSTTMSGEGSAFSGSKGFTDTENMAEAVNLALNGWDDGEKTVRKLSGSLFNSVASRIQREEFVPDVTGMFFDVPSVVKGTPDAWYDIELREGVGRVVKHVHILYNCAVSCGIDKEIIVGRGSAIAALVELLEFSGAAVTLDLAWTSNGNGLRYTTYISIKQPGQPLELSRLAMCTAHPSTCRRFMFSAMEQEDKVIRQKMGAIPGHGYGTPTDAPKELKPVDGIYLGEMLYDSQNTQWTSPELAAKWLVDELQKQGVYVEGDLT